jgi:hypothetical protein
MNGAIADPAVRTIKPLKTTRNMTIGSSQNFLRSFIKLQSSIKKSPILLLPILQIVNTDVACEWQAACCEEFDK